MKHVLVMAGETEIASRLQAILTPLVVHTEAAFTIRAGLEIAEHQQPDLVLADFTLADGTAVEFCEKLRRQLPDYRAPFLCLASPRQAEHYADRREGGRGPQDWIRWPAREDEVRRRVGEWLGRSVEVYAEEDPAEDVPIPQGRTITGSFARTPFARVLHELDADGRAGFLDVSLEGRRVELHLREGLIAGLRTDLPLGDRLRDELVGRALTSPETWHGAVGDAQHGRAALIRRVTKSGTVDGAELSLAWVEVGETVIFDLFSWAWRKAEYAFRASKKDKTPDIALALKPTPIIFEGVRRHYSADRLGMIFSKRGRLKRALFAIPDRPRGLPAPAARILRYCDNHRTAPDVLALCGMQKERYFQTLYAMWVTDLVRFGPVVKNASLSTENLFEAPEDVFLPEDARR